MISKGSSIYIYIYIYIYIFNVIYYLNYIISLFYISPLQQSILKSVFDGSWTPSWSGRVRDGTHPLLACYMVHELSWKWVFFGRMHSWLHLPLFDPSPPWHFTQCGIWHQKGTLEPLGSPLFANLPIWLALFRHPSRSTTSTTIVISEEMDWTWIFLLTLRAGSSAPQPERCSGSFSSLCSMRSVHWWWTPSPWPGWRCSMQLYSLW